MNASPKCLPSFAVQLLYSVHSPSPLVLQHLRWGRTGWGHQGRFEISQEIHRKLELWGDGSFRTPNEKIL